MPLITDLNDRERKTFAGKADNLADAARKLSESLRKCDDTETLVYLVMTALAGAFVNDLTDVFRKAVGAEIPDDPGALTPPTAKSSSSNNDGKEN